MSPAQINPLQWHHAMGVARQACARVFRDGGSPADALAAFGLTLDDRTALDWSRAVDVVAQALCAAPERQAA